MEVNKKIKEFYSMKIMNNLNKRQFCDNYYHTIKN